MVHHSESEIRLDLQHVAWVGGGAFACLGLLLFSLELLSENPEYVYQCLLGFAFVFAIFSRRLTSRGRATLASIVLNVVTILTLTGAVIAIQHDRGEIGYLSEPEIIVEASSTTDEIVESPVVIVEGAVQDEASLLDFNERLYRSLIPPALVLLAGGLYLMVTVKFLPSSVLIIAGSWLTLLEVSRFLTPVVDNFADSYMVTNIMFGIFLLLLTYYFDLFSKNNHGFWCSKLGWFIFGTGMGQFYAMDFQGIPNSFWPFNAGEDLSKEIFLCVCFLSVLFSVFLRRPGGISVAAIGIFTYFADHFETLFGDRLIVGAILMVLFGLFVMWLGTMLKRTPEFDLTLTTAEQNRFRPNQRTDPVTFGF